MTRENEIKVKELIEYINGITVDGPSGIHFQRALIRLIHLIETL